MKVSLVVSLVFVVCASVEAGAQSARIRALDEGAREALEEGLAGSPEFRRLASELDESDLIVHVVSVETLPGKAAGTTLLSSSVQRHRYVRISVLNHLAPDDRVAILGHELQHACEIAHSRAFDTASVRSLFQSIGQRVEATREAYETAAAIDAGTRVWHDLRRRSRRTAAKTDQEQ